MLGTICVGLISELYLRQRPMVLVETGTLRDREGEPGVQTEERSTLAIAQLLAKIGGNHRFCSIDADETSMAISKEVLQSNGMRQHVAY